MKSPLRHIALALATTAFLGGCTNTEQQTQQLVQARLDAEKVKDLTTANTELKTTNDQLKKENDDLKQQLAKLVARLSAPTPQAKIAKRDGGKPSPADSEALKESVTGGSSFK